MAPLRNSVVLPFLLRLLFVVGSSSAAPHSPLLLAEESGRDYQPLGHSSPEDQEQTLSMASLAAALCPPRCRSSHAASKREAKNCSTLTKFVCGGAVVFLGPFVLDSGFTGFKKVQQSFSSAGGFHPNGEGARVPQNIVAAPGKWTR